MALCVGCGFEVIDGILEHKLDPAGNITCGAAGLAVAIPAVLDPISPDACNGVERRGNGLYVPCPDAVTGIIQNDSVNNDLLPLAVSGVNNTYTFSSGGGNTIANPLCCDVSGIIAIRAGGLYLEAADGFYGSCKLQINPNGVGLVDCSPDTTMVFENQSGSTVHTSFNNFVDENWISIPAGGSITYAAALVVFVNTGAGTLSGNIKFEYVLTLPQTECC
jgi:hypothetical protein